jgi:LDH2 family malate/lactate/ureidoglycolate dehydrogenase
LKRSIIVNKIPYQKNFPLVSPCFFGTGVASSKTAEPEVGMVHVTIDEATEMTTKALRQIGWDEDDAKIQAEVMVSAELCGNNQGLVKMYQPQLMAPSTNVQKPNITRETAISAVVDAQQSPGMIAAMTASNLAVQKVISSNLPIAIVATHNSSTSSGQLAHYVERIAKQHNMIGIAMCNSPEMVAAAPGTKPVFGTNPIAISIPLADSPYPYTVGCLPPHCTFALSFVLQ